MEKLTLSTTSTEDLQKKHKLLASITAALMVMLLLLVAANVFLFIKKGFTASAVIPLALLPLALLNAKNLKDIKTELKARESSRM